MSDAIDDEIGHVGNEIDMTNRKEGVTRWYDDDVGSTTINLSALLNEKDLRNSVCCMKRFTSFVMRMSSVTRYGCTVCGRCASLQTWT